MSRAAGRGRRLRRRLMRQELRARPSRSGGSLWLLFLAFAPALIIAGHALHDVRCNLEDETLILAGIVQLYYVRFGVFFGCLGIFVRLFRGELAERTLHYAFLAPVRREVLVVGKFLAGVLTAVLVFGAGILASFAMMYRHFDAGTTSSRTARASATFAPTCWSRVLACLGYGAVFLAMSLVFKNPIVPGGGRVLLGGHQRRRCPSGSSASA